MKIEKLPSGSYRVRKYVNGKSYSLVFNNKPTQKDIDRALYQKFRVGEHPKAEQFSKCLSDYIESRQNVISPATYRSYKTLERSFSDTFLRMNIYAMEQVDIQNEVNRYAKDHAPKTVRNFHGLISAVFSTYRPQMVINTTLPQKVPSSTCLPSEKGIKDLLIASENSKYHVCFQLGILGLRRGEVCGLNIDTDLNGNELHIHQVVVEGPNGFEIKPVPKNETSNRIVILPDRLVEEIKQQGYITDTTPAMIVNALHSYQKMLGLPQFRFHDLRHYFASYAHSIGIPDAYIMEMGGWKTTHTMNKVYKEAMKEKQKEMQVTMGNALLK